MARKQTPAEKAANKFRTGRPPKKPGEAQTERLTANCTRKEKAMVERDAKQAGIAVSDMLMRPWRDGEE